MIWEGLSDRQLCELLKDSTRNGHRTAEQIVEHMNTPLVLWGWAPGDGRTPRFPRLGARTEPEMTSLPSSYNKTYISKLLVRSLADLPVV
jgi:hypothetical protein